MVKFVLISLEGNIGAGKSTIFSMIKQEYPDAFYLNEPLEAWQSVNNDPNLNILEKFYSDPLRWGYTFQVYAYQSRLMAWDKQYKEFQNTIKSNQLVLNQFESPIKENDKQFTQDSSDSKKSQSEEVYIVFTERSVESSRSLFFKLVYKLKYINEMEYHMYEEFYQWLMKNYSQFYVDQVIYINTPAEECLRRLKKRGRDEEVGVSLDYLRELENCHQEWFKEEGNKFDVLDIDATSNYISDIDVRNRVLDQIRTCINSLKAKFAD